MADDMLLKNFGQEYMSKKLQIEAERRAVLSKMSNRELALEVKKGSISLSDAMRFRTPAPIPANLEQSLMQSEFAGFVGACRRLIDKHPIISHYAPIGRLWTHGLVVPAEASGLIIQAQNSLFICAPEIFGGWSCKRCEALLLDTFKRYPAHKVLSAVRRAMLYAEDLCFSRGHMVLREAEVISALLTDPNTSKALYSDTKAWSIFSGWANKIGVHVEAVATPKAPEAPTAKAPEATGQENDVDGGDMYVPAGPGQ